MTTLDRARRENSHRFPQFLPDGRHFLFLVRISGEGASDELMVGSLGGRPATVLMKAVSNAAFVSGRLLTSATTHSWRGGSIPRSLRLEGEEVVVGDDVHIAPAASLALFSASRTGTLVYDRGSGSPIVSLRWLDRGGRAIATVGEPRPLLRIRLSPDGRRTALSAEDPKTGRIDVFILDMERGVSERLTSGKSDSSMPLWRRDGTHVVFPRARGRAPRPVGEGPPGRRQVPPPEVRQGQGADGRLPDGRYLALRRLEPEHLDAPALAPRAGLPVPPIRIPRGGCAFLPGRPLGGLRVPRGGPQGDLRHVLPEAGGRT